MESILLGNLNIRVRALRIVKELFLGQLYDIMDRSGQLRHIYYLRLNCIETDRCKDAHGYIRSADQEYICVL